MALDWETVKAEHIQQACERLAPTDARKEMGGLVVWFKDQMLPAKKVLKTAYRIANRWPDSAEVTFSSGDTMLNRLQRLGFRAERRSTAPSETGNGDDPVRIE